MSDTIPDIVVNHCDQEMPDEFENFYKECDRLYNRVSADFPVCPQQQCKKDSRYWLHKNRSRPSRTLVPDGELVYEQIFSVVGLNGRRFKKDSRVWLHKTSEKAAKLKQFDMMAKQKQLEKNSNCKMTPSFCNAAGVDEDSLTAMSNIAICNDPRCQCVTESPKRHHETDAQGNNFVGVGVGCRNRKRRKVGHSVPTSPAHHHDSSLAVVSKSLDREIGFSGCLDKLHGNRFVLESESSESLDLEEPLQRSWKNEKSPCKWREFKVVSSASSSSSHGSNEREAAVPSGGSINLVAGNRNQSETTPDVHRCVHVQYTPKRKVSVYNIVNEDFYDYFSTPVESSWVNIIEDSGELDMEEAF